MTDDFNSFDDSDLGEDLGISLDNLSDDDDSDIELGNTSSNNSEDDGDDHSGIKKTAIFCIIAGVVVLILLGIVARIVKIHRTNQSNKVIEEILNEETDNSDLRVLPKEKKQADTQLETQPEIQPATQQTVIVQDNAGWTEAPLEILADTTVEGEAVFTVSSFKTYANFLNGNEVQVKTILTGSLAGYSGTYSVEIPFNLTRAIEKGMKLNATFNSTDKDGNCIISDIQIK